jgi:hypothetical protein
MTTLILIKIVENKKGAMLNETLNAGCRNSEDWLSVTKRHGSHSKMSLPIFLAEKCREMVGDLVNPTKLWGVICL